MLALTLLVACSGEKSPVKLTVTEPPASTKVVQGGDPDFTGGVVTVEYEDGTTKDLEMSELEYRGLNNAELGQQTVALIYTEAGKTVSATVDLTVVSPKVTALKLQADTVKKKYIEGETFDKRGLVVIAAFQTGEEREVEAYEISPLTMTPSTTAVTVTYRSVTATIPVSVEAHAVLSAVITSQPTKREYFVGETFLSAGLEMKVTNNDGTVEVFSADQLKYYHGESSISYYGAWTKGDDTIRVVADALYGSAEAMIKVTVKEVLPTSVTLLAPTSSEDALIFAEGDPFDFYDPDLVSIRIDYNNGTYRVVEGSTDYFDYDTDTPISSPDTFVTIRSTEDPSLTLNVPIVVVEGVEVSVLPTKTSYTFEDDVDLSGLELLVTLAGGGTRTVAYSDTSRIYPNITTVGGEIDEITVRYLGFRVAFAVTYSESSDPDPEESEGGED